jgi:predicted Zn-dependent protease with MMP-like domain
MMPREQFEKLVVQAVDDLPPFFQLKMSNIEILLQPWPTSSELRSAGVPSGHTLLGLYTGVPLTERTSYYGAVPPDTITLYQGPIEEAAGSPDEIGQVVRDTVIHEIAHHFGISDERLRELGAY